MPSVPGEWDASTILSFAGVMPEIDEDEKLSVFREFINSLDIEPGSSSEGGEPT